MKSTIITFKIFILCCLLLTNCTDPNNENEVIEEDIEEEPIEDDAILKSIVDHVIILYNTKYQKTLEASNFTKKWFV